MRLDFVDNIGAKSPKLLVLPMMNAMVFYRTVWHRLVNVGDPTQWDKAWLLLLLSLLY